MYTNTTFKRPIPTPKIRYKQHILVFNSRGHVINSYQLGGI